MGLGNKAWLLSPASLLAIGMALAAHSASARDPVPLPSERCEVLASELALTFEDRLLIRSFCEALGIEDDPATGGSPLEGEDSYFVKCRVEGDPEWIGFRLVTRKQCEEARGEVQQ